MRRDLQLLLLLFVTAGVRDLALQLKCFSPGGPEGTRLGTVTLENFDNVSSKIRWI